ncbi:MAG TPA: FAD-dependent oxidoreductase [Rhizomicrobium sp.]|jgi:glycine/D-amino acid oxidase-like deaminating enzyme
MSRTADVAIIGGGIIGMCIALQIARRSRLRVLVLEKGIGPGEGSTGASSAVCRYKYSRDEMVRLASAGIAAYKNWPQFLGIGDPAAAFHQHGMLWLGDGKPDWPIREAQRLTALGVRAEVLDDAEIAARFPAINPCVVLPNLISAEEHDCVGGALHLLEVDGGYFDPMDALQDLIRSARLRGVEVSFRSKVEGLSISNGRVAGIRLADGTEVKCGCLINAAGPWCNEVFDMAGLPCPWPLAPTRIQIALVDRPPEVFGGLPVCADIRGGIYFRTQNRGQQIIVGSVREEDEQEAVADPGNYEKYADDDFIRTKLHALQHRIPSLKDFRNVRGYSGLYTVNRRDVHPIVGSTPIERFYVANGFSGHGFKLAPAIGALVAKQITGVADEFDAEVDEAFLAFDRVPIDLPSKSVLA